MHLIQKENSRKWRKNDDRSRIQALAKTAFLEARRTIAPQYRLPPNKSGSEAYQRAFSAVKSILSSYHKSNYEKLLENEGKSNSSGYIKTDEDVFTGICTIPSAHISEQTAQNLEKLEDVVVSFKEYDGVRYGAYVYWNEYDDLTGLPEDLCDCIRFARDHGCSCLCLDSDGKELPEFLPVYARKFVEDIEREE